jgi:uncharacterized protein (DUF58 family)
MVQREETDRTRRGNRKKTRALVMLPYVAAGESKRTAYRITLPNRGHYRFGPLNVFTRFPLGLLKASLRMKSFQRLTVYPRLGRLQPDWLHRLDTERCGVQQTHRRQGPIDGDYYGLREWRSGDSRRWIHWRTSAKLGKLAVRQFEQQLNRDLILVLDLWLPKSAAVTDDDRGRVELAISLAATLIDDSCRHGGGRLAIAIAGQPAESWSGTATPAFEQQSMERLTLVSGATDNGLDELLLRALGDVQPCYQVVVISTRSREAAYRADHAAFAGHPRQIRALQQVLWVNVADERLASVFDWGPEVPVASAAVSAG